MCKCTPNKRTPFCGAPGCEWPRQIPLASALDEIGLDFDPLSKDQPPLKKDVDLFRWILDAKVRALAALCGAINNGKGSEEIRQCVNNLAWELVNLKLDGTTRKGATENETSRSNGPVRE